MTQVPLLGQVAVVARFGFIDGYPMQPRYPLDLRSSNWGASTLIRTVDRDSWRHAYGVATGAASEGAVSLGAVWTRSAAPGLVELHVDGLGRVSSDLLEDRAAQHRLRAVGRWVGAPLTWTSGKPKLWAMRAAASRARAIGTRAATRPIAAAPGRPGRLRCESGPDRIALFSASHRRRPGGCSHPHKRGRIPTRFRARGCAGRH